MKNSIHNRKSLQYIPLALMLMLMVMVDYLPPVQSQLGWRVDELYARIKYFFNPSDQAVFRSEQTDNFESIRATTRAEHWLTPTPALSERPLPVGEKIFRVI